jgi:arsenite methyltransferase
VSREKEWVKQRYGALASRAQQACCGDAAPCCPGAPTAAESIGYSAEDLAGLPEGIDLSLGCGNPLALAAISPGETVLDLGCGAGLDVFLAAQRVGDTGRVIGIDLTPEMIEQARANAARGGCTNVEFRLGDIESLPVEDASIDLVVSNCVLVLVPDKAKAFRDIVRVLKPGGRIAISDIVLDGPLPEAWKGDPDIYCSCVSGAAPREKYLADLRAAGITGVRVVSQFDAADLLAADCCGADLAVSQLRGVVTSIQVVGRKPAARTSQEKPDEVPR